MSEESVPRCSPELIRQARQLRDAGHFQRRIITRKPVEIDYDEVELECGHKRRLMDHVPWKSDILRSCEACITEWINKNNASGNKSEDRFS